MGNPQLFLESSKLNKPSRVRRDETTGEIVIEGVRYLGSLSRNVDEEGVSNEYPLKSRKEAQNFYENLDIYLNHTRQLGQERGYEEKMGKLRGPFRHEEEASFANLHLNPKHPLSEQVAWDAEHSPSSVGLSHSAYGVGGKVKEGKRPIKITGAKSVDIVASPATSTTLFESEKPMADADVKAPEADPKPADNGHLVTESAKKIEALESEKKGLADRLASLELKLSEAEKREAEAQKRQERDALIAEHALTEHADDDFRKALYEASDESAKSIVLKLKAAVFHETPESVTSTLDESETNYAEALETWAKG